MISSNNKGTIKLQGLARFKVGEATQFWSRSHFWLEDDTRAFRRDTN